MSATGNATTQAMAEWMKLFPLQITETYSSSVKFMKQLTVVAISTITYLKNVLSEDSYTVQNFGGMRLKILKKNCSDELAQFLNMAMNQAFEAFDKKYLGKMVICFYDGDYTPENLIEYHSFEYKYNSEGMSLNVHSNARGKSKRSGKYSFDNIKEMTIQLIRACVVIMQVSQYGLPESYDVCVRLYYNEDAPKDYQAPGFISLEGEEDHLVATLSESIKLGFVETPFHRITPHTYIKETIASSHEANPTQNPPEFEVTEDDFQSASTSCNDRDANSKLIQCPCNLCDNDDDGYGLITCQYCKTQQHAACFGLYREKAERLKDHCCTACTDADPSKNATDKRLAKLIGKERKSLSMFRRALSWCAGARGVSARQLGAKLRLPPRNALRLLGVLHSHRVVAELHDQRPDAIRQVLPEPLKRVMSDFFYEEPDHVEHLIHEALSQGSQFDPLGEILSPMERSSLGTAATTSQIIEPKLTPVVEDEHLKDYMNAISEVEKENYVSLNSSHNPIDVNIIDNVARKKFDEAVPVKVGARIKRAKATQSRPETQITSDEYELHSESMLGSIDCQMSDLNDTRVQCPCNLCDNDADGYGLLICQCCNTKQHAACFGLYRETAKRLKDHCCTACTDADPNRKPTDKRLAKLIGKERKSLSMFRRALSWCAGARGVSARQLGAKLRLPPRNALRLLGVLHSHRVVAELHDQRPDAIRQVLPEPLKRVMSDFFYEEPDHVEHLIHEALSQGSQFDPLGEILSPMERSSLGTAATTSQIIEPKPTPVVEDEHLKDYMNAITEVEKENCIPLSGSHNPINVDNIVSNISRKKKSDEANSVEVKGRIKRARVRSCRK